ncbi:signal peptidase II [Rhodovulum imhoffii]|uniref:Lipoprotein signal peptidase n=1 Tax=Rhodovulum imhoffii TaxID=365340 RepID=A0A2T5BV50_9RHOB|nr:signal peptidase II [Rhodovulum imhoffii]MBK5934668.1 signal peptidase II [Rhodovulum imhoffii]PTN03357.1 signal peptidase II [Rhodovulum imhoffii]
MGLVTRAALILFVLDQAVKIFVVQWLGLAHRLAIDVVPPFFNLRMAWNRGMNFGLFANDAGIVRWGLVVIALAVSAWVLWWVRRLPQRPAVLISAGVLVGGALGNAVDRVVYGAVADFINMSCCGLTNPFAFNLADIGIFAGAFGLVLFSGRDKVS